MREDIKNLLKSLSDEDLEMINKSEMARRYNCDARTIYRYLKIQQGLIAPKKPNKEQK